MARVVVEAVVATSHPLPAYGGVRVGDEVLTELAAALRSGRLPMFVQHDLRRPLDAHVLDSNVRDRPDGYKDVWIRFDVDADQWQRFDSERIAAGAPGGFSFSCSEPIAVFEGVPSSEGAIELAADASYWADEDLTIAAKELRRVGDVSIARRYEFAHDPPAVVAISLAISGALGILSNALYDGLKHFLLVRRKRQTATPLPRPTIYHFRLQRSDGVVEARLETDDPEALRQAIASFDQLVTPRQLLVWNDDDKTWEPQRAHPPGPSQQAPG